MRRIGLAIATILVVLLSACGGRGLHVRTQPFTPSMIHNFGEVEKGRIYRGSQPFGADFTGLKNLGIKTVLDLRNDPEKTSEELALQAGLVYKHVGMSSTKEPRLQDVQIAVSILVDPANQPVFVHCESGKHRSGLIVAVYRVVFKGWDKQKAWAEAVSFDWYDGFNHAPLRLWFFSNKWSSVDFSIKRPQR